MSEALLAAIEDVAYAWSRLVLAHAALRDAPHATLADECGKAMQPVGALLDALRARQNQDGGQ